MIRTILEIEGMSCGMCEAHINETIRRAFSVKSVKSSRKRKQTQILSEEELSEEKLVQVIAQTGYRLQSLRQEEVLKKGLFG